MSWARSITVILFVVAFFPQLLLAQGNIHMGKLGVLPSLSYKGTWNDNIYLTDSNEEDDYLHTITPSLVLDWRHDANTFARLGYQVDMVKYDQFEDNDFEIHNLNGAFQYRSPQGYYLKFDDTFIDSADPYGSDNEYKLGVPQTERWNNSAKLQLGYEFGTRYRLEFGYTHYLQKYDAQEDKWQNQKEHEPSLTLFYRFLPKTSLLFHYRLQMRKYPEQNSGTQNYDSDTSQDFRYHKVFTGLHWDATAKINGELKLGLGKKVYDNSQNPSGNDYNDSTIWIAETQVVYKWRPKTQLMGSLMREAINSPSSAGSTEYEQTEIGIGLRQQFMKKFQFNGQLSYTNKDYTDEEVLGANAGKSQNDELYNLSLNLDYRINPYFTAGLEYTHKQQNSNFDANDYTGNVYSFKIKGQF